MATLITSRDIQRYIQTSIELHELENAQYGPISREDAGKVLDEIWKVLDSAARPLAGSDSQFLQYRNKLRKLSLKLSIRHDILPSALILREVQLSGNKMMGSGSFADVFAGTYNGEKVALKRLRVYAMAEEDPKQKKLFLRECLLWKNLIHENIVSFYGVSEDVFEGTMCMVIAWMGNGTVASYIVAQRKEGRLHGDDYITAVDLWLYQIASALCYLHEEGLVHGDLHGGNVLIDDSGNAHLADFGMALVTESSSYGYASIHGGGAVRWKAPELIDSEEFGLPDSRPTPQSDVFSYACVCIELYSGKPPMYGVHPNQVPRRYMKGLRPPRPELPDGGFMPDDMWNLTRLCWKQFAKDRLSSAEVLESVAVIAGFAKGPVLASGIVEEKYAATLTQSSSLDAGESRPPHPPAVRRSEEAQVLTTAISRMSLSGKTVVNTREYINSTSDNQKPQSQAGFTGLVRGFIDRIAGPSKKENTRTIVDDNSQGPEFRSWSFPTAGMRTLLIGTDDTNISREEMRSFKKVWDEFANPRTGYLEGWNFVRFSGNLSGVFEVRVYPPEYSVRSLVSRCSASTEDELFWPSRIINLEALNAILATIDVTIIKERKKLWSRIFHEARICSEPGKGISRTNTLQLLIYHKVTGDTATTPISRYETNKVVQDLINLDRVQSLFMMIIYRRRFLAMRKRKQLQKVHQQGS